MTPSDEKMTICDRITLKNGRGGMPYLELRFNGAEAHLYLHGGHVLHYQPAGQPPVLWCSQMSAFEPGKAIRGGIPICWPWFGAHPVDPEQPAHGIARLVEWEPVRSAATSSATTATLKLPDSSFPGVSLELTVELNDRLTLTLTTANHRDEELHFTEALHSYFSVQNIRTVTVAGLEGDRYIDSLSPSTPPQKQTGPISFFEETDRIYMDTQNECTLVDVALKRSIHVRKENSLSTVVWNPWIDKSIRMPDFGNHEFIEMVCVETANCGPNPVSLAHGQSHAMRLQISPFLPSSAAIT